MEQMDSGKTYWFQGHTRKEDKNKVTKTNLCKCNYLILIHTEREVAITTHKKLKKKNRSSSMKRTAIRWWQSKAIDVNITHIIVTNISSIRDMKCRH